jgi:hypothetical protein
MISLLQGRCLHTGQHKQNKRTQASMLRMRFEPTIPAFERAKTVIGGIDISFQNSPENKFEFHIPRLPQRVPDNFLVAVDALRACNIAEHFRVEITRRDAC